VLRELERRVVLSVLDRKWREHLYEMDYLQEGIGLRAMGQRDPLVEYQREGFDMFSSMMEAIKEESVGFLFNVEVQLVEEPTGEVDVEPAAPVNVQDWVADDASGEGQAVQPDPEPAAKAAPRPALAKGFDGGSRPQALTYTAPTVDGDGAVVSSKGGTDLGDGVIDATGGKPGRNDPCPCGSGRKYKRCHGDPARRSSA
jgi:preprotein translocase subunit SecA